MTIRWCSTVTFVVSFDACDVVVVSIAFFLSFVILPSTDILCNERCIICCCWLSYIAVTDLIDWVQRIEPQSVGRHDTESTQMADWADRIVSDELMILPWTDIVVGLVRVRCCFCCCCFDYFWVDWHFMKRAMYYFVATDYHITTWLISSLEFRSLRDNQLDGTIPSQVGRLTALQYL